MSDPIKVLDELELQDPRRSGYTIGRQPAMLVRHSTMLELIAIARAAAEFSSGDPTAGSRMRAALEKLGGSRA